MTQEYGPTTRSILNNPKTDVINQAVTQSSTNDTADDDNNSMRMLAKNSLSDGCETRSKTGSPEAGQRTQRSHECVDSHRSTDWANMSTVSAFNDTESEATEVVVQQLLRKASHAASGNDGPKTAANYSNFASGFQRRNYYEHSKKLTDFVDGMIGQLLGY